MTTVAPRESMTLPSRGPPLYVAATSSSTLRGNALTLLQTLRDGSNGPAPSWAKSVMKMSLKFSRTLPRIG